MSISVEYKFNLSTDPNIKKLVRVTSDKIQSSMHTMVKNRIDNTIKKATGSFKPGAMLIANLIGKYIASYIPLNMSVASETPLGPRTPTGIWTGSLAKAITGLGAVTRVTSGNITMQFDMIILDMPRIEHSGIIGEDDKGMDMTGKGGTTGSYGANALMRYPDLSGVMLGASEYISQCIRTISVDSRGRVRYFKTIRMLETEILANESTLNAKIIESAISRLARKEK
jgi:hypothetical protein